MDKALFNQVGEVKGKVIETEDSFSFQFTPQNDNLKRTRGALFTLVTITGAVDDKVERAKAYYHTFQSSYYAKSAGSIINGLSETLDHVEKEFAEKETEDDVKYSLVAAVFWGAVLYLAKSGNNSVFISRGGKLRKLDFNKIVSGVLEDQDTVCLATEKFSENVDQEELGEMLGGEKFESVLEKIDKRIATVPGAVCDVVRLSVNAPENDVELTTIGEVDENGNIDMDKETSEEEKIGNRNQDETDSEPKQVASINESVSIRPNRPSKLNEIRSQGRKLLTTFLVKVKPVFLRISKPWRKGVPGERVDHVAVRKQRLAQIIALVVVVLVGSLILGFFGNLANKNKEKINSLLQGSNQKLSDAATLKSLNPNRATTLVNDAKKLTAEAKKLDPKNPQIASLESQEALLLAEINRSYNLNQLTTVADLTKISKQAKITRLALKGNIVFATDKDNNKVYSIDLITKEVTQIDGNFNKPANLASFSNGFYIQNTDGVKKVDQLGKVTTVTDSSVWGNIVGLATYQNFLYLLDKDKGEIWRYTQTSAGLSPPKAYLQGDKPSLSNATGIAIDTYVWLVTKKGEIIKLALGKKQDFTISNMREAFSSVVDIYTDTTAKNLYLLDSGKGRIVVIGKDGVYQAQYSNDQLHQATSLVVQEDQKTAYVAVNGKLLSVTLSK